MADIEYLYRLDTWQSDPVRYRIVFKTAKTFKVSEEGRGGENTVKSADIGDTWFHSQRDAYARLVVRLKQRVVAAESELQRARGALETATLKLEVSPVLDQVGVNAE